MARQAESAEWPGPDGPARLSEREMAILAFEHEWWTQSGAKDEAIRLNFELSAARYYQLLNALIDTPAAIVYDPMLVRRLQRVRDARTHARAARIDQMTPAGRTRTND